MTAPNTDIEADVRRYLTRAARRYVPGVVAIAVVAVAITLVPPKKSDSASVAAGSNPSQSQSQSLSQTQSQADAASAGAAGPSAAGAASAGSGSSGVASGPGTNAASPGQAAARSAVARSGVTCAAGVRQVTWSRYAPLCVPAFTGDNGGATAPGVTKDAITISYRYGNSTQMAAVKAAAGSAASSLGGDQQQMVADLQTYIDFFNRNYELYGRKVVLKPYNGQGDFLAEYQGQNASGAQADAATAKDMGAFADISTITQTQLYAEALASQHIVSFGAVYLSQSWFDRHAPYAYSWLPAGTRVASFIGNVTCQRLAGLPATFAGDPAYQQQTRVFGIMNPENPDYAAAGDLIASKLSACGQKVAAHITYALDITKMSQQDTNAIAQLHSAGVTTVLCLCDEFTPIYTTQAADQQQYRPEWVTLWWPDPWGRLASQDQWSHTMSAGGATPAIDQTEAYRVYKLANSAGPPQGDYSYPLAYQQALMLFASLQAAGPGLNPVNLARGSFSLPAAQPGGDLGPWTFGSGVYTPKSAFQLGWWSPSAPSGLDGTAGSYQNCARGTWYPFDDANALAPAHTQPNCFGH